jgi:intracellular sulfur oxidation DsrE/DsrF family protein
MAALQREFKEQGLAVIGVDLGDDPDDIEEFKHRHEVSFPIAVEELDQAKKMFGILGCPATVLIDRKGRMVGRAAGEGDWTSESARTLVRSLLGITHPAPASSAPVAAETRQARKAVHLVSAVRPNDPTLNEMLAEAADALKAGDEVVVLFDGQSVGALRTSASKTPLESAAFTPKQRTALAKRLAISEAAAPINQFEYIQRLQKAGAKVLVNRNAIRALGLSDAEIHPIAKRISVGEMEQLVDESDACYTYSHD